MSLFLGSTSSLDEKHRKAVDKNSHSSFSSMKIPMNLSMKLIQSFHHFPIHRIGWWENFNRKGLYYLMVKPLTGFRCSDFPNKTNPMTHGFSHHFPMGFTQKIWATQAMRTLGGFFRSSVKKSVAWPVTLPVMFGKSVGQIWDQMGKWWENDEMSGFFPLFPSSFPFEGLESLWHYHGHTVHGIMMKNAFLGRK